MLLLNNYQNLSDPQKIIHVFVENFDGIEWEEKIISRRRQMPGELAQDEAATSAEEKWRCEIFYTAVDSVIDGINERFYSNRHVLETLLFFHQKRSPHFLKSIQQLDMLERM